MTMDLLQARRLMFGLMIAFCTAAALAGCSGGGGDDSVPFSAMTGDDGTGSSARFKSPVNAVMVGANLYVTDYDNHSIRKIALATGVVTTFAGSNGVSGSTNGTGAEARFNKPYGITSDGAYLYITDSGNHTIRKIAIATGTVSTLAGTAGAKGFLDRPGAAAKFTTPTGIATDDGTNLYVTDTGNNVIRKIIVETGAVTTLSTGTITADSASFVFATVTTSRGTAKAARFKSPYGVATDTANLYVANTGNSALLKMAKTNGAMTPMAVSSTNPSSSFVFSAMTATKWSGSAAQFKNPYGITTDGANLYLADSGNNTIRKLVLATDQVSTLAGTAGTTGAADGVGAEARFNSPTGITTDDGTNLYIADDKNTTVRKAVVATGAVSTLAGKAP